MPKKQKSSSSHSNKNPLDEIKKNLTALFLKLKRAASKLQTKGKHKKSSQKIIIRNVLIGLVTIKLLVSWHKLRKGGNGGISKWSNKFKRKAKPTPAPKKEITQYNMDIYNQAAPSWDPAIQFQDSDLDEHDNANLTDYYEDYPDGLIDELRAKNCPHPQMIHWKHYVKPIYEMDREKFLIPILNWGPNNQVTGLYESMILARHLNRTFVMPPFYRHEFDPRKISQPYVGVESRVNPNKIREYLTTVPLSYMKTVCDDTIHVGYVQHNPKIGSRFNRIHEFENATGVMLTNGGNMMMIPLDPVVEEWPQEQQNKGVVHEINDTIAWNEDYTAEGKCAAWVLPYMSMKFKFGWQRQKDEQEKMVYELLSHVEMPKYITETAQKFIDDQYQPLKNFFAVHWRFDPKDWQRGCSQSGNSRQDLCALIESITPKDVAGALLYHMAEKLDIANHNMQNVFRFGLYIASPDDSRAMVNAVIEIMKGYWVSKSMDGTAVKYYSSSYLDFWLNNKFPGCEIFTKDNEVISMLEQGIVMNSKSMLTSTSSSWSLRVTNKRKFDKGQSSYPADRSLAELIETYLNEDVENGKKGSIRNKRALEQVKREILDYIKSIGGPQQQFQHMEG